MINGLRKAELRPLVAPEISVHIMILGPLFYLGWNMSIVEPPLKKSEVTRMSMVPNMTNGKEFGLKLSSVDSSLTHHLTSAGQF